MKVLLVDDNPLILKMATDKLSEMGCEVSAVKESRNIRKALLINPPELVILDLNLDGAFSGESVGHYIRSVMPNVTIVILSESDHARVSNAVRDLSAVEAIPKDDSLFSLGLFVRSFMRKNQSEDSP